MENVGALEEKVGEVRVRKRQGRRGRLGSRVGKMRGQGGRLWSK